MALAFPGSAVLYRTASGLETAMADADAERLVAIEAELVRDVWDSWRIAAQNLPYLAWAMGASLWEPEWAEHTRREWTARQWEFKALRGTPGGVAMALDFVGRGFVPGPWGYSLVEIVTPPQGFYASPNLTAEEWNAWIRLMPELRIKLAEGVGAATGDEWIAADGFVGMMGVALDDGPALYGRRAVLRRRGVDTPLQLARFTMTTEQREAIDYERVCIPGMAGEAFIAGEDMLGDDRFVDAEQIVPQLLTVRIDSTYDRLRGDLQLTVLVPGLDPLDINYERNSDIGDGGTFFFARDFAADGYADNGRDAADMLADRIYLNDPDVAAPMMEGISFAGVDRVGAPKYRAELLVDLRTSDPLPSWFAEDSFATEAFAIPDNLDDMDRALRGVVASKAFRDRVAVSFETVKPIAFGNNVTEESRFGDEARALL